eukprot:TRINITY_DN7085_c1_g1_i1.p1 TRINITY_DN7085_c1_g1~~TRINITY_DN7085_c1_g1_i1.p1  ORF type:complete len:268 (+),score=106.84 TRINITY_DN7085_c1_g1_i1:136-939(+)
MMKNLKNISLVERNNQWIQSGFSKRKNGLNSNRNHSNVNREKKKNYEGHIPISSLGKLGVAIGSSFGALSNPFRGDLVASLGETTGSFAVKKMLKNMKKDSIGVQILNERPTINEKTLDLNKLRTLSEDTFGGSYIRWMDERGFSPDSRSPVHFVDNEEEAYVLRRYREVHDFWHVLSGLGTTVQTEIALKWFEMIQTELPVCALSAIVGPIRLPLSEKIEIARDYIPWAIRSSRNSKNLMNVYYEHHFEKNLDEFRRELNFEPFRK